MALKINIISLTGSEGHSSLKIAGGWRGGERWRRGVQKRQVGQFLGRFH